MEQEIQRSQCLGLIVLADFGAARWREGFMSLPNSTLILNRQSLRASFLHTELLKQCKSDFHQQEKSPILMKNGLKLPKSPQFHVKTVFQAGHRRASFIVLRSTLAPLILCFQTVLFTCHKIATEIFSTSLPCSGSPRTCARSWSNQEQLQKWTALTDLKNNWIEDATAECCHI